MQKSIQVDEDTHERVSSIKRDLQATNGRDYTYGEVIAVLVAFFDKESEKP